MKNKLVVCFLALLAGGFGSTTVWAQTNSWNTSASDKWESTNDWSLGVAPASTQSIYISNAISKIVTIDATTRDSFPGAMTVNDLNVWSPDSSINELLFANVGGLRPLTVLSSLTISNGGELVLQSSGVTLSATDTVAILGGNVTMGYSSLVVSNVAVLGTEPGSPGTMTVNGTGNFSGALCVGFDTNGYGSILLLNGQLTLTNGPTAVGLYGYGQLVVGNNSTLNSDQSVIVGEDGASQGALVVDSGSWSAGGDVLVGEYVNSTGMVQITSGQFTAPNNFLTLIGGAASGQMIWSGSTITVGALEIGANGGSVALATNIPAHTGSQGTLTIANSAVNVQGPMVIGTAIGATGAVWMTGGQVVATNSPAFVGEWGDGTITISNGNWIGSSMLLGMYFGGMTTNLAVTNTVIVLSQGALNLDGGSATLYSNVVIGNCPTGGVGVVNVAGGSLYVTNAAHNAFIDVRDGQLNLNAGLLQTDVLILTNACGQFIHTGGTLIAGSVILNTSAFQITSITPQGNDLLIAWTMGPGLTNALQASAGGAGGSYTSNGFADIFVVTTNVTPGTITNYLDVGAATNSPARYYRVRLRP